MRPVVTFEQRKFCQIRNLAVRWDCSTDRIKDLVSKGILVAWHPEGKTAAKGVMIDVQSVLKAEEKGVLHGYE